MSNKTIGLLLGVSILAGGVSALAVNQFAFKGPSKVELAVLVQQEIASNPKAILDSINGYMAEQQLQESKNADQKVIDQKEVIAATSALPFSGAADGSVELVYFFDVNCGYCKRLDPTLKKITEDNPDVRVSHREIPILSEGSRVAALYSNIVWERHQDKYSLFHNILMSAEGGLTSPEIEGRLAAVLGAIDAEEVIKIAKDGGHELTKKSNELIESNLKIMKDAGITGTPFVYVLKGDSLMRGAGEAAYNELLVMIEKARKL